MPQEHLTKNELLTLEKRYWNAIKEKDSDTATALSADPCLLVGPQGLSKIDRKTLAGMLEDAPYELEGFSFEDVEVRPVTDDVVALTYKVKEDLVVDGEEIALEAFESSVWVRRDGKWVCVLHTETLPGDPFGRH